MPPVRKARSVIPDGSNSTDCQCPRHFCFASSRNRIVALRHLTFRAKTRLMQRSNACFGCIRTNELATAVALASEPRQNQTLGGRPYIAGEQFTVADITALTAVSFMKVSKLAVPQELANLRRWREAVSARPRAKA